MTFISLISFVFAIVFVTAFFYALHWTSKYKEYAAFFGVNCVFYGFLGYIA
jgi:hypothetical protein